MKRDLPLSPATTYYGLPAIKASPYRGLVAVYTFVAGLSGAAQIIATLADLFRMPRRKPDSLVRNGRLLAAAGGAVLGPALLILDLHKPVRWYNMLRIYRRTSPMSIGSYVLTTFGGASAATALGHFKVPGAARFSQVPAAVAGAGMTAYTAPLLSATATPLWASTPRPLAVQFAASAFASGAAALSLAERCSGTPRTPALEQVACAASAVNFAATIAARACRKRQGVPEPQGRAGAIYKAGVGLGIVLPLACYAVNALAGPSGRRSALAAAGILAGTLLSRWAFISAGNQSAERPGEYLRYASRSGQS